jgi:predicted Zn-dependent protease with MMP-like domain
MMEQQAFEIVVRETIERLQERFRHALENVAVVVKEEPDMADFDDIDVDANTDELFGLYIGVPLTERGSSYTGLPDRIEIYRGPILRSFDTLDDIIAEIEETLIHELGHHMGLDDEGMAY